MNQRCCEAAGPWLPIEEAPKDGTELLLCWMHIKRRSVGMWHIRGYWSSWWGAAAGLRWSRDNPPSHFAFIHFPKDPNV